MPLAYEWRMQVMASDGTIRSPELSMAGPNGPSSVPSLSRFDVAGSGNCLEAEFAAVPSEVVVQERDVVTLYAREYGDPTWTPLYRGVVVISGARRSREFRMYKVVGLKQRFYEIPLDLPRVRGAEVARMVEEALASVVAPTGVTFPDAIPDLGFVLGDRFPQMEYVGTFLDDVAASVGRFVVPPGQTYTSNGVTYHEGEIVPGVEWGVDREGRFFFERPAGDPLVLTEGADPVNVTWNEVLAEEVYDRVALVFATEYADGAYVYASDPPAYPSPEPVEEAIPHPLAHTYGSGAFNSTRLVPLTTPMDYMRYDQAGEPFNPDTAQEWSSLPYATDGNPGTYALADETGGTSSRLEWTVQDGVAGHAPGIILRVVLQRSENVILAGEDNLQIHTYFDDADGVTRGSVHHHYEPATGMGREVVILPLPVPAQAAASYDVTRIRVHIRGAAGVRLYDMRAYALDVEAAERLAQAYVMEPERDPAQVRLVGLIGDVRPSLVLGTVDGEDVRVPLNRVEYSITNEGGIATVYYAGQAFDSELMSQQIVLERLAQRAVKRP